MSNAKTPDTTTDLTNMILDVARLEEKINAITEKLHENTEITQENLNQLQEVRTVLRVMEAKIQHLEKVDEIHDEFIKSSNEDKREWKREIVIALFAFALGLLGKWLFGIS